MNGNEGLVVKFSILAVPLDAAQPVTVSIPVLMAIAIAVAVPIAGVGDQDQRDAGVVLERIEEEDPAEEQGCKREEFHGLEISAPAGGSWQRTVNHFIALAGP